LKPGQEELFVEQAGPRGNREALRLKALIHYDDGYLELAWLRPGAKRRVFSVVVKPVSNGLQWATGRSNEQKHTSGGSRQAIRLELEHWARLHPVTQFEAVGVCRPAGQPRSETPPLPPPPPQMSPWDWLAREIERQAQNFKREQDPNGWGYWPSLVSERKAEAAARRRQNQQVAERQALERAQRRLARLQSQEARPAEKPVPKVITEALPPVPVRFEATEIELQETGLPLSDLSSFKLRERASLWWVSNQSDDLLCLPYCRLERLEYQVRSAVRVLGPLRGRALLSDEVGLGKTIEAGLVLKELLTRGMVKRFLVLTVPSLVDQWEEELNDKFGLTTATTNRWTARGDGGNFWRDNSGIIASLHLLKQPAHLAVAREVKWDMLVVDEAHYLRNSQSQAWQAVSALPRQFLLLLTATPVQNSLEELYNLVTLLQPGQLPPPREFRKRFIDPKRPRKPREPEELRRLLGQVMIRNTRANAGLKLPARRAETVLFEPGPGEKEFWDKWETDFRKHLESLNPSQASLWGRLLLQAAGSSPAAWRAALTRFPDAKAADAWRQQAPLEESWQRKCDLLPPLTRGEGGVVIFTQFLETQAALAERLHAAGVRAFVINGNTPAAQRQPITQEFRQAGGALLLTHSGTEGRNLQFCHCLVNFDLPWNPMEIEQRIGRLHRYGQRHPVRIYNFTQRGTLQEHLLEVLQEKLNLFELVVGETGLVLGERFDSEAFAEEVLRRWRDGSEDVAAAIASLGDELAAARDAYQEIKKLDETLFADDFAADL
jgi:superfamily II DNA or RNA helicase